MGLAVEEGFKQLKGEAKTQQGENREREVKTYGGQSEQL